ncbi:MAG TPA: glycosyl hydrolase-related protein, partial [Phycisphaerae bacterium]|nr:glycosyl hydrolase-related protein [Phycisphaerae bacterium]
ALLNRGLPSYAIEPHGRGGQVILLSVLRSPALPTYLHEPQYYVMTDYDGMRDEGEHRFEYALAAYDRPFADSDVVGDAESYNAGLLAAPGQVELPEVPRVVSDHVRLAAMKLSEKGRALILRLFEFRGRGGAAELKLPDTARSVQKVNLLERNGQDLEIRSGGVRLPVRAWEIATLRLALELP